MANLPTYVEIRQSTWSESFDPSVQRTEMERGVPKQSVLNTGVLMKMKCSLIFRTTADDVAFLDWYFDVIRRVGFFTMTHPRTGQSINARFEGGNVGEVRSIAGTDGLWQRDVTIEYMR